MGRQLLGGQERVLLLDELLPRLGRRLLLLPRLDSGSLLLSLLGLELLRPEDRLLLHHQQLLLLLHGLKDGGLLAVLLLASLGLPALSLTAATPTLAAATPASALHPAPAAEAPLAACAELGARPTTAAAATTALG